MIQMHAMPELHLVFEALGYWLGLLIYRRGLRNRTDVVSQKQRWTITAAAMMGALAGSRILGLVEQAPGVHPHLSQLMSPGGGKTIVGGLLGGWIAVEITKKAQGITVRTGDLFAIPLCVGIAIGRVGCLFAGLADGTYGTPTHLPWGVDFGDGVSRHPTQAYEILFLCVLLLPLRWLSKSRHEDGILFRCFMAAYLLWRFLVDFIKPQTLIAGMNAIQWACLGGLVYLAVAHLSGTRAQRLTTGRKEYV